MTRTDGLGSSIRERLRSLAPGTEELATSATLSRVEPDAAIGADTCFVDAFETGHVSQTVVTAIDANRREAQIPVVLWTT
jgi:hypothetical protein